MSWTFYETLLGVAPPKQIYAILTIYMHLRFVHSGSVDQNMTWDNS